jgi:hypothetical protein
MGESTVPSERSRNPGEYRVAGAQPSFTRAPNSGSVAGLPESTEG